MSQSEAGEQTSQFGKLLRELSVELRSKDVEQLRLTMLALDRVDGVLASLRLEQGIHVYRGVDIVEEYERSLGGEEVPSREKALDYIIRKENVELQLEVEPVAPEGLYVTLERLEQYERILVANPKTEEIVLVWGTEGLDSIAFDLDQLRQWSLQKGERFEVPKERVGPLEATILAALGRHRRVLREPQTLVEARKIEFDLVDAFSSSLRAKLGELRDSAARKRAPERIAALLSLSESDQRQIEALFSRSRIEGVGFDELKEVIEAICENVEIHKEDG